MNNTRRTKIIATLGPSTDSPEILRAIIQAGVNVVRINFSHGSQADQKNRIELVRKIATDLNCVIGIIADLQGPKIRIASFKEGVVHLSEGATFILDVDWDPLLGDDQQVGLEYKNLVSEVVIDDILVLDDGLICLKITDIQANKIITTVIAGGRLSSKKGVNKKGGGLCAPAFTLKDLSDLQFIAALPIDYIAMSFVKSADDIRTLRLAMNTLDCKAGIIAKIERTEAIAVIDQIIMAADAVMVARGDLGIELGYPELPGVQKMIIRKALEMDKVVITATQMMESMINSPIPTRAEVSDVANAVMDGTDAVMLSAETATGKYPVQVVAMMHDICVAAEKQPMKAGEDHALKTCFLRHDEAIAMSAMYVAGYLKTQAIIALTESGMTPLWMSRVHVKMPIYALSRHEKTCRKMTLLRGVYPILFDFTSYKSWEIAEHVLERLLQQKVLTKGDTVILTKGDLVGLDGHANTLKVLKA